MDPEIYFLLLFKLIILSSLEWMGHQKIFLKILLGINFVEFFFQPENKQFFFIFFKYKRKVKYFSYKNPNK